MVHRRRGRISLPVLAFPEENLVSDGNGSANGILGRDTALSGQRYCGRRFDGVRMGYGCVASVGRGRSILGWLADRTALGTWVRQAVDGYPTTDGAAASSESVRVVVLEPHTDEAKLRCHVKWPKARWTT
jgi:hypothetical protein